MPVCSECGAPCRYQPHPCALSGIEHVNPDAVARLWRIDPAASAWPGQSAGLSAAVFSQAHSDNLDLFLPDNPKTHVLTIELAPCRLAWEMNGKVSHDGRVERGAVVIVRAGERPRACVTGSWKIIQFYLPARDLRQLAEDLGVPSAAAQALEILDPAFLLDQELFKVGAALDRRLKTLDVPSRLEFDELGLAIGEHLVRRYSNIVMPAGSPHLLSAEERRAVISLLYDQKDAGLEDIARELDRPVPQAAAAVARSFSLRPAALRKRGKR